MIYKKGVLITVGDSLAPASHNDSHVTFQGIQDGKVILRWIDFKDKCTKTPNLFMPEVFSLELDEFLESGWHKPEQVQKIVYNTKDGRELWHTIQKILFAPSAVLPWLDTPAVVEPFGDVVVNHCVLGLYRI